MFTEKSFMCISSISEYIQVFKLMTDLERYVTCKSVKCHLTLDLQKDLE